MAKRNIGATLSLNNGNFFTNMKSATSASNGLKGALTNATSTMKNHGNAASAVGSKLKSLIGIVGGVVAAYASVSAIKNFGSECLAAANKATEANTRLNTIMKQIPGNTDKMTASVAAYASKLSKITTIGATAQKYGASQLASFQMSADSIKKLMPQLDNLAVAQYGVNVSGDQMVAAANMIGKAYAGQTGAMTRAGIVMSKEQANLIKTGNEATKTATLVEVLQQNFGNLSEEMAKTPEGAMIRLKNNIAGIKSQIGTELQPVMTAAINYATDKIPMLADLASKGIEKAKPVFEWVANTAIPAVGGAIGTFIGSAETVIIACEPSIHRLGEAFGNVSTAISGAFGGNAAGTITNLASIVLPRLINTVALVVNGFSAAIPVVSALSPIIAGIASAVTAYKVAVAAANTVETIRNGLIVFSTAMIGTQAAAFAPLTTATIAQIAATSALNVVTSAFGAIMTFITSPIGLVVIAIGAVIAIGVLLVKHWDKVKETALKVWNGIKNVVGKTMTAAKDTVKEKLNNIKSAYEEHGGGVKGAAAGAMEAVKGYYTAGYEFIDKLTGGKLSAVVNTVKSKLAPMVNVVKDKFSAAWESIKTSYNDGKLKPIVDKIGNVFGTVKDIVTEKLGTVKDAMTTVFTPIAGIVTTIFGGVKGIIANVFDGIKSYIANTVIIIRKTIMNIILGIKQNFAGFGENVINAFQGIWNGIRTVFDGIKSIVTGVFQIIAGIFTLNIDTIKNGVQTIKDGFATAFEGVKQIVLNHLNGIKSYVQLAFDNVRTIFTNVISGIGMQIENVRTTVGSVFESVKTTISNTFDSVKTKVTNVFETVKTTIKNAIDKIKGMFNFTWELPKIKLPHFSITPVGWKFSDLLEGSIPKLNTAWYANGGIMQRPTMFGMNGNSAMVGGEAGPEAILPLAQFWDKLERFMDQSGRNDNRPNITNHVYVTVEGGNLEDESLANTVAKRIIDALENM